jgi:S-adenosylmethionine hydrolase
VTGIFAEEYRELGEVRIGEISVKRVNSFVQVDKGEPILYENSFGLLELAVNHGRADEVLGLKLGSAVIV